MNDKKMIRRKVREVLAMAPDFGKTETFLAQAVNSLFGGGVPLQDVRDAMDYNLGEKLIRSEEDKESEQVLWFITTAGIARNKQ
jgi:hypothetical protein